MAISQSINNALSGLRAVTWGTNVASSNLANVLTEGYGVRRVTLEARDLNGLGAGVRVTGVQREGDPYLVAQRRLSDAAVGHDKTLSDTLVKLESIFNGKGKGASLADGVTAVEKALTEASADPSSPTRLQKIVYRLTDLTAALDTASDGLRKIREQADQQIGKQVSKLTSALEDVDRLNDEIVRTKAGTGELSGLIDQRQKLIDSISELVPVRQLPRDGGRVALMTTGGEILLDHRPREIGFVPAGQIAPEDNLGNGALHRLTIDGQVVAGGGAPGNLGGGAIAANFEIRDTIAPQYQKKLDDFAQDLLSRLSDPSVDPSINATTGGLLVKEHPSNPALPIGLAGELKVNPVLIGATAETWRLRDGIGAAAPGDVGNPSLLLGWSKALSEKRTLFAGEPERRVGDHISTLSSDISGRRIALEDRLTRSSALRTSFVERERALGVDTDTELQNLLVLEKAYAANAKVLKVADTLLRNLLEI